MRVTFRQLQVFESVARHRSHTAAARALHLSQPAVSMQVKQLEEAVGLPLFEQVGKRLHLTEAGAVMRRHAHAIATQVGEAEDALDELKRVEGGRLRLSVVSTVNYFASRLLAAFCRGHPGVRVSLDVTNRQAVIRQLEENATDVVLMGRPPAALDVVSEEFMDNPLVAIAAPSHPLSRASRLPLTALANETFLLREPGSGTRIAMERFFEAQGLFPSTPVEMTSNEAIKQSVEAGLGLAVVSSHTVELELEAGRITVLDLSGFPIRRKWYVVHRREKRLSATAAEFKRFAVNEARRYRSDVAAGRRLVAR